MNLIVTIIVRCRASTHLGVVKKDWLPYDFASKGISTITWNVLGLPQTVTFTDGATVTYSYAADGTKLRESRTVSGTTTTTDYTGDLVLENGTRSRLLFDGNLKYLKSLILCLNTPRPQRAAKTGDPL